MTNLILTETKPIAKFRYPYIPQPTVKLLHLITIYIYIYIYIYIFNSYIICIENQ